MSISRKKKLRVTSKLLRAVRQDIARAGKRQQKSRPAPDGVGLGERHINSRWGKDEKGHRIEKAPSRPEKGVVGFVSKRQKTRVNGRVDRAIHKGAAGA